MIANLQLVSSHKDDGSTVPFGYGKLTSCGDGTNCFMESEPNKPKRWSSFGVRKIFDYAAYFAVRCCIVLVQATEFHRCERWCRLLSFIVHRIFNVRGKLVLQNLQGVFPSWSPPEYDSVTASMWQHLFLMICEIAHAPRKIHRTNWFLHYKVPDRQSMSRFFFDKRAKVVVTGHFGNFELAGYLNGLFGLPSTTVARTLDNQYLHQFITKFRSQGGQHLLSKDKSANEIQKLLEAGGTLALLADQDAGTRGCWVDFLGMPASSHKAVAVFTLINDAPMMVCFNRRLDKPMQFELGLLGYADLHKPAPHLESVQSLTQWYNDQLGIVIRQYPDQYWWLHRRWREPPPRLRRAANSRADDSQPRNAA